MRYSLRSLITLAILLPLVTYCVMAIWTYMDFKANYRNAPSQVLKP